MENPYRLEERVDCWVLHLGQVVVSVSVGLDYTLSLTDGGPRVFIAIGGRFRLVQGCVVREFNPDKSATLGSTLLLVGKVIERAVAYKDGRLHLEFEDGSLITTGPDPKYESWQIQGPDAPGPFLIACGIGGELSVWDGEK